MSHIHPEDIVLYDHIRHSVLTHASLLYPYPQDRFYVITCPGIGSSFDAFVVVITEPQCCRILARCRNMINEVAAIRQLLYGLQLHTREVLNQRSLGEVFDIGERRMDRESGGELRGEAQDEGDRTEWSSVSDTSENIGWEDHRVRNHGGRHEGHQVHRPSVGGLANAKNTQSPPAPAPQQGGQPSRAQAPAPPNPDVRNPRGDWVNGNGHHYDRTRHSVPRQSLPIPQNDRDIDAYNRCTYDRQLEQTFRDNEGSNSEAIRGASHPFVINAYTNVDVRTDSRGQYASSSARCYHRDAN